jgi:hypothetical protein
MTALIIIFIIIILIFIPIPVKVSAEYVYGVKPLMVKIYGFSINVKKKMIYNKEEMRKVNRILTLPDIRRIFDTFENNKFKPAISISYNLNYGLDDAAYTAISYGVLYSVYPLLQQIIGCFFNVKNTKLSVQPIFDQKLFNFNMNSIILVSFAQVIHIGFYLFKLRSIKKIAKET